MVSLNWPVLSVGDSVRIIFEYFKKKYFHEKYLIQINCLLFIQLGCGRVDVPGVYVKVSSFIGWINQIISVNNL